MTKMLALCFQTAQAWGVERPVPPLPSRAPGVSMNVWASCHSPKSDSIFLLGARFPELVDRFGCSGLRSESTLDARVRGLAQGAAIHKKYRSPLGPSLAHLARAPAKKTRQNGFMCHVQQQLLQIWLNVTLPQEKLLQSTQAPRLGEVVFCGIRAGRPVESHPANASA